MRERPAKESTAFRTISEVAEDLGVAPHVLRFWESKFSQVRPLKRAGGRRYYRPEDVEILRQIKVLLHQEGYTIRGAQKLLRQRRAQARGGEDADGVPALFPARSIPGSEEELGRRAALVASELRDLARRLRRSLGQE